MNCPALSLVLLAAEKKKPLLTKHFWLSFHSFHTRLETSFYSKQVRQPDEREESP
jgi:hypothetical protein